MNRIKKIVAGNLFVVIFIVCISCEKSVESTDDKSDTRTFLMGFQNSAPRVDFDLTIQSLTIWTVRSDAAMITTEVPWDSLIAGIPAEAYVNRNYKGLVDYYRSKNLKLWVYIDPANGLDRAKDANILVNMGISISQPNIQKVYRRFTFVMDSILNPEHLGLALETNFIREIAPDSIYKGVKQAANDAAKDIRAVDKDVKLSISIQVDWAWGKLYTGPYRGIAQDFIDFPFMEELGMSSYPYFGFEKPQDIPDNYYSKLIEGKSIPVFISEGGWSSGTVSNYEGTLQKQTDYITRNSTLLNKVNAIAYFQLTFTDIDLTSLPPNTPANISNFAYLGLVDINLQSKPALAAWDLVFKKKLE